MNGKKAFIISCFDEYDSRNKFVEAYFKEHGFGVQTFISDFHHQKKQYINIPKRENVHLIHTTSYTKNISFARIKNHYVFAKKVVKIIKKEKPDIVYANIPPNFIAWYLGRCRKNKVFSKLIFDIYDMWPETMIFGKSSIILKIPFFIWRNIRNKFINEADLNITACELHEEILRKQKVMKLHTLHLLKDRNINVESIPRIYDMTEIKICYLGTVNNIIDINMICNVIKEILKYKRVSIFFIGNGETKGLFLNQLIQVGANVKDLGVIYDDFEKEKILLSCHFGLNIMKKQVCVGVTLKSLEYFSCGLPILNSIPCDTENLVVKYNSGINIANDIERVGKIISRLSSEDLYQMKINTLEMFNENFSVEHFNSDFNYLVQL